MCLESIIATNMGFVDCVYRIRGRKEGSGHRVIVPWTEVGKEYQTWDSRKAGLIHWEMLFVETKPLTSFMPVPDNQDVIEARVADECAICLDKLGPIAISKNEVLMMNCTHSFHEQCASQWIASRLAHGKQPTCPLCRNGMHA